MMNYMSNLIAQTLLSDIPDLYVTEVSVNPLCHVKPTPFSVL